MRVALILLAAVAISALIGVIFPQAADDVRAVPASYDAFTEFQRSRYGIFTTAMRRLGVFEVFHSYWFNGLILVLLLAVAVCIANRIPPTVRNVRRPVRRVNDRFFERAHHRTDFQSPPEPGAVERVLRRRGYRVSEVRRDGDATYLFADRFPWAQYGTFLSHLSLILFMSGAIVTKVVGFSTFISISQGSTYPVFSTIHAGQMQVENLQAGDTPDGRGLPTRFYSNLAVFRDGRQICTGTSTVNDPMHCAGYTFHQTAFSSDGVALQVRDLSTGQVVYNEVSDLDAQGSAPSPHLVIQNPSGAVVFDDNVVLAPINPGDLTQLYAILPISTAGSGSPVLPIAVTAVEDSGRHWAVGIFHPKGDRADDSQFVMKLQPGQSNTANGFTFSVTELKGIPLGVVQGVPGMSDVSLIQLETSARGERYLDLLDMGSPQISIGASNNAAGAAPAASSPPSSESQPVRPQGAAPAQGRLDLVPNVPQVSNGFQYTFLGVRSVTGITVRKDPGSTFIWVATALMILGLGITFYVPRRRLWVKFTPERTYMAGVADRIVNFAAEMRRMAVAAGSPDVPIADDD